MAQSAPPDDFLGLPGPFAVRGVSYGLAWSSRPSLSYVKQEYVAAGDTPERFGSMVLVELVTEGLDPKTAAAAKVRELKARKASDPTVNYAVVQNAKTGEVLLDFTLSAPDGDGVSEWNGYRYAPYATPDGAKGVVLLGLSRRAYGAARVAFFKALKAERRLDIQALAGLPMPKPALAP